MFIMQTIRKWVECNKVITCHCSYLFVCLYFCMHFCISEHLCVCVCLCLCVYAYMRAISAASMSCGVSESPEALAANSLPVKALPYLMIHERVKQQWKPAMKWKYHLIIPDQITSFITHDLTIYGAYNAVESRETFPGQTEIIGWLRRMFAPAEETKG